MNGIAQNIGRIREEIAAAATGCGRNAGDVALVAVSKNFARDHIQEAISAGQYHFGENRVQEAESKIPPLRSVPNLTWHMIGHLQSNKAHRAAELFDVIHSVDSVKLAGRLSQAAVALGKTLTVLIQVDLGHEAAKFGADQNQVANLVGVISNLQGLRLSGLMTLPPLFENPELARPYFRALRELLQLLEKQQPGCLGRGELSMGMSLDFKVAIEEGATMVRIGSAIFGERTLLNIR
jgi:pyridoxal phosphate enzyme (YggS family)